MFLPLMEASCNWHFALVCRTVSDIFCTSKILLKGHLLTCSSSHWENKKLQITVKGENQSHILLAKIWSCCCSLVSTRSTKYVALRRMFKPSLCNSWYVPYEGPGMPAISENCTLLVFLDDFANFLHVSSVWTVEERPERSQSSNEVSSI